LVDTVQTEVKVRSPLWNRIFLVLEVVTMDSDWEVVAGDEEDILCALPLLESK
jgi:hypothetical protein